MSLVAELQRRRVFRALVGYGIAAFAILQIIEPIMHGLHWPDAVLSYVVVALAVGFPIVVSLAWIFDVNAGRIERTAPAPDGDRSRRLLLSSIAGAAVLLAIMLAAVYRRAPLAGGGQGLHTLAVLPLANVSGDLEQEYFVDGMTDALITELAQVSGLRVISRTSSMRYKSAPKPLPQVVKELGADAVIEGSVERSRGQVRIAVQLINARTDTHLWARSYTRPLRDVLALQEEVARAVAGEIRLQLTPQERARFERAHPVEPAAYEAYLKGLYYWNFHRGAELGRAREEFERAIQLDPGYARAYVGLSDLYHIFPFNADVAPQDYLPKAKQAALKAIELEPDLSDAHASLGFVLAIFDWDWAGAEREYKQAIALSPSNSVAHGFDSMVLSLQGKHEEALSEAARARELDPVSGTVGLQFARVHFFARQYDRAAQAFRAAIEVNPTFWPLHLFLGHVYTEQGSYADALSELRKAQGPTLAATAAIGHLHAVSGNKGEAEKILRDLIERSRTAYLPPSYVARIYAGLGERDKAIAWLEKAYGVRDGHLALVGVEPAFDPLRDDPRFIALLRRLNLAL